MKKETKRYHWMNTHVDEHHWCGYFDRLSLDLRCVGSAWEDVHQLRMVTQVLSQVFLLLCVEVLGVRRRSYSFLILSYLHFCSKL